MVEERAIEIARKQSAKSLELRATTASRGCSVSMVSAMKRAILSEIYGWFSEGFDTADLKRRQGAVSTN